MEYRDINQHIVTKSFVYPDIKQYTVTMSRHIVTNSRHTRI